MTSRDAKFQALYNRALVRKEVTAKKAALTNQVIASAAALDKTGVKPPRTKDKMPQRPKGISDGDWQMFLENQLHIEPLRLNPMDHLPHRAQAVPLGAPRIELEDRPDRRSHFWDQAETELSKLDPDYVLVENLIGKATADDINRMGGGELKLPRIKLEAPQRPLEAPVRLSETWGRVRSTVLFTLGLGCVLYAAAFGGDPYLLALGAAIMGLPAFYHA